MTLIRAAAKNHSRVTILSDPSDYAEAKELESGRSRVEPQALRPRLRATRPTTMTCRHCRTSSCKQCYATDAPASTCPSGTAPTRTRSPASAYAYCRAQVRRAAPAYPRRRAGLHQPARRAERLAISVKELKR